MPNIVAHIARVLANHVAQHINEVRAAVVYNFGTASEVAADQLAAIFERERAQPSKAASTPGHPVAAAMRGERWLSDVR